MAYKTYRIKITSFHYKGIYGSGDTGVDHISSEEIFRAKNDAKAQEIASERLKFSREHSAGAVYMNLERILRREKTAQIHLPDSKAQ